MEKGNKLLDSQNKIFELIKEYMSVMEGEEFSIKNVELYQPYHTSMVNLFGPNHHVGYSIIIGNEAYMNEIDNLNCIQCQPDKKFVDLRSNSKVKSLNINEQGMKSVVLEYSLSNNGYSKVSSVTDLKQNYPYLVSIIKLLNKMPEDLNQIDKLISELEDLIESYKQVKNTENKTK